MCMCNYIFSILVQTIGLTSGHVKVAGTVLKRANYSLLAVTTVMQYAHTYVSFAVRLPALRVINVRVHVRFHREAILPELVHP